MAAASNATTDTQNVASSHRWVELMHANRPPSADRCWLLKRCVWKWNRERMSYTTAPIIWRHGFDEKRG